jgi:hypothetical protein
VAALEQRLGQVRADEAGPAGNENSGHQRSGFRGRGWEPSAAAGGRLCRPGGQVSVNGSATERRGPVGEPWVPPRGPPPVTSARIGAA